MTLKWAIAVLAVLGAFFSAGILGSVVTEAIGFWHVPGAGFSAAAAVVVSAYLASPSHRFVASLVALLLGAVVAWLVLEPSWLPESYRERGAYEPTHLPVIATYLGGIVGLAVVALLRGRARV